jgi:hypothetical protein
VTPQPEFAVESKEAHEYQCRPVQSSRTGATNRMGTLAETTIPICVEATRLPDKKKDEQKTKILPTLLLQDGFFTREVGVCERDQSQKAKSFTRRKEGGGESGLVIVTGRITSAINKKRGGEGGKGTRYSDFTYSNKQYPCIFRWMV